MKTVVVTFPNDANVYNPKNPQGTKAYHYLCNDNLQPTPGQAAVVMVGSDLRFVKIEEVVDLPLPKASKHLVAIIDLANYRAQEAQVKKRKILMERLARLEQEQSEMDRYTRLAQANTEAAGILEQLKAG